MGTSDARASDVTAEIIADQPIDTTIDAAQIGTGIESLGRVTMHGAVKAPTFVRLAEEPLAGQSTLTLEQPVSGWKAGDHIALPDTRQLRESERLTNYVAQDERLEITSIAGNRITLSSPLKFDHKGARDADGKLEFLPHVGNVSRNVVVRSRRRWDARPHDFHRTPKSTARVEVLEMGRTRMGVLDNTLFDAQQMVRPARTRLSYAITFTTRSVRVSPANGYQFT